MNISRVLLSGFMSHANTDLVFPKSGLVLVTGQNGHGKSSIVEAVSVALWGKTLRGTSPWMDGVTAGWAGVETDVVEATRTRGGQKTRIDWKPAGQNGANQYENNSKAQEALEALIGEHDTWRKTSVFSSQDATHFTLATDGERKRLLESILDLAKFDDALAKCRTDLKERYAFLAKHVSNLDLLEAKQEGFQRQLKEAQDHLAMLPAAVDIVKSEAELARLRKSLAKYFADVKSAQRNLDELRMGWARADAAFEGCVAKRDEFKGGKCGTCGRGLPKGQWDALVKDVELATEKLNVAKKQNSEKIVAQKVHLNELEEEQELLQSRVNELQVKLQSSRSSEATRDRLKRNIDEASSQLVEVGQVRDQVVAMIAEAQSDVKELEAVEQVLGLKGVRAAILSRALKGLEQAANAWLCKIADRSLRVVLKPYSEKKSGGVSDAISFEVLGAGGGNGYRGASGGERRRIDVACLLALAEVAQHAYGRRPGTIFADECFDALDSDGTERVASVLAEVARERCVCVISHNEELASKLNAQLRLHVANGKVAVVRS